MSERDKELASVAAAFVIGAFIILGLAHLAHQQPVTPADTQEQADLR